MCKSKEEFPPFGKVCDVHNNGNKATIEMSSQLSGVPSDKVTTVFNDLRKEGKGLPDPSEEEVQEYVSSQVFTAKYDPNIKDNSRSRIVNWWRKARDTQPSGGLMHAWKNTLPQTLARYRRTAFASVAMFSIALTSACGSTPPQNNTENTSSPIATTAPATPSEEATVKPTETAKPSPTQENNSITTKSIDKLKAQGISIGDTVKVKGGSYPQYEVSKSSHLGKFSASKHTGGTPKGWSKTDLQESQVVASNYVMNFFIDNPTVNDYESNKKEFANSVKETTASMYKQEFYNGVMKNKTPFLSDTLQTKEFTGDKSKGFRFVSDGKTPRIADVSNFKVESSQNWEGGVYYQYSGPVTMNVIDKDKNPYTMDFRVSFGMTVVKEKGEYKIFGANNIDTKYQNPTPTK